MRVRESGMPERAQWERYFDPASVLSRLGLDRIDGDVIDFGCGYGTFALAIAPLVNGTVYALDLEQALLDAVSARAQRRGIDNIEPVQHDFMQHGSGLPDGAAACALLFNILHTDDPLALLAEARRTLRPGGRIAVIHWRHDPATPRGPPLAIRPPPARIAAWATQSALDCGPCIDLPPYHFGFCMTTPVVHAVAAQD